MLRRGRQGSNTGSNTALEAALQERDIGHGYVGEAELCSILLYKQGIWVLWLTRASGLAGGAIKFW